METETSKSYQLRVRVTDADRALLDKLAAERGRGETLSDLVREAISLLARGSIGREPLSNPETQAKVEKLAQLLKREPRQVEEACVDGILDLIERKVDVPLIVMETQLHLKYREKSVGELPWSATGEVETKPPSADPVKG